MKQEWQPVVGFENDYHISNCGKIMNFVNNKIKKSNKGFGHYLSISMRKNNKTFVRRIHRLVAQSFIPNPENKPCVNHKNGIKTDNRVENLEWCTHKENTKHAINNGLMAFGEKNTSSVLNEEKVKKIRKYYKKNKNTNGCSYVSLGDKYGVAGSTIYMVVHRKSWKHI